MSGFYMFGVPEADSRGLRVRLEVRGIPAGVDTVALYDLETQQRIVETAVAGSEAVVQDWTAPVGVAGYLAKAFTGGTEVASTALNVETPPPPPGKVWLSDPLDETSAILVDFMAAGDRARDIGRTVNMARTVSGRSIASVGPAVRGTWEIVVDVDGPEMIRRLQDFFMRASSILVRGGPELYLPAGRLYGAVPMASEYLRLHSTALGGQWTLSVTPADGPGILPVISSWTWEGLEAMCDALGLTWDDLPAVYPTWLHLERGPVGDEF